MAMTTEQKIKVRVIALESPGGVRLQRHPGPGGRSAADFYRGEVFEAGDSEAEHLARLGLVEFVDRVTMRALVDDAYIGGRSCRAGEEVVAPAHHALRLTSEGIAERA